MKAMKATVAASVMVTVLAAAGFVTARAQQGGVAEATRVAVVNMQQVITQSKQQASVQSANAAKGQQLVAEEKTRRDEIAKLATELDPLVAGGDAWLKKRDQIQEKQIALEVWVRVAEQNSQLDLARQYAQAYQAATDAVAAIASAQGYDIVLQTGELPDLMTLNVQQLQGVVQGRKVIYGADAVDITQAVLGRMNAEFDNRK